MRTITFNMKSIFLIFFIICPVLLFSFDLGGELKSNFYYGLPIFPATEIFKWRDDPNNVLLNFQFDFSYFISITLRIDNFFCIFGVINQHVFLNYGFKDISNESGGDYYFEEEGIYEINQQEHNLNTHFGIGYYLIPRYIYRNGTGYMNRCAFSVSALLYIRHRGTGFRYISDIKEIPEQELLLYHDWGDKELHFRFFFYLKLLEWLEMEAFIEIPFANDPIFFLVINFTYGGSHNFNLDLIFKPFRTYTDLRFHVSFLFEKYLTEDTDLCSPPRFQSPRIGIGFSHIF